MMKRVSLFSLAVSFVLACGPHPTQRVDTGSPGAAAEILMDGSFEDWAEIVPLAVDPVDDVREGSVDFSEVKVSNGQEFLFLKIELGRETIWQNEALAAGGNDIRIYLDGKAKPEDVAKSATESFFGSADSCHDLEIHLGSKRAMTCRDRIKTPLSLNEVGLFVAPTHSSSTFELAIPFSVRPQFGDPVPVIEGPVVSFSLWESQGGDRLPDKGLLHYRLLSARPPPPPLSLEKERPQDIRVLSHNVLYTGPASRPDHFRRYLQALQPEIVNFQEMWDWSEQQVEEFVQSVLKGEWHVAKVDGCVTASRFPIRAQAGLLTNLVTRIDLPDRLAAADLVLFNTHSPCCGDNSGRDYVHDLIASAWRDLLTGEGLFSINARDTVVMLGDFNMVGFQRQLRSIRDGKLINNEHFGPDFSPARSHGSLTTVPLRHTHSGHFYTWQADPAPFTPGRLDYIFFSGDTAQLKNNFVLWTREMPEPLLRQYGLERNDSPLASDHLVLVADFAFR